MELVSCFLTLKGKRSSTINDIPDSLLIEILIRLPLKSAKQCMLVSKHWYAIISTPYFARSFLSVNYISTLLISREEVLQTRLFVTSEASSFGSHASLPYLPCPAVVVAWCQDLVLCRYQHLYYIGNPLTGRWIQLPPSPPPHEKRTRHGFTFEGDGSNFKYAVVRIPIIHFRDRNLNNDLKVQVFTSDSGVWIEKKFTCRTKIFGFPVFNCNGIPHKGMLFWICFMDVLIGVDPFNEGESLRVIDLPPGASSRKYNTCVAVFRGMLRLLEIEHNSEKDVLSIRIWDFKDYEGFEWSLEHGISFFGLQSKNTTWFKDTYSVELLSCDPNNGDIVYIKMGLSTIVSCNLRMQTLDVICDNIILGIFDKAFVYVRPWQPTSIPNSLPLQITDDIYGRY